MMPPTRTTAAVAPARRTWRPPFVLLAVGNAGDALLLCSVVVAGRLHSMEVAFNADGPALPALPTARALPLAVTIDHAPVTLQAAADVLAQVLPVVRLRGHDTGRQAAWYREAATRIGCALAQDAVTERDVATTPVVVVVG